MRWASAAGFFEGCLGALAGVGLGLLFDQLLERCEAALAQGRRAELLHRRVVLLECGDLLLDRRIGQQRFAVLLDRLGQFEPCLL